MLGHVQRACSPTPFDRTMAAHFGTVAVAALAAGRSGSMVALRGDRIEHAPLSEVLAAPKHVDGQGERVTAARAIGTIFGDEALG